MSSPIERVGRCQPPIGYLLLRLPVCVTCAGYHFFRLGIRLVCRRRSAATLLGEALADLCEQLGGGLLKLGQLLSTRIDLLPEETLCPLRRLQDAAQPLEQSDIVRVIERSIGRPLGEMFASFEPIPVASASIAQVHRAMIRETGEEVAVKIRRPGIDRLLATDAWIAESAAAILAALPWYRGLPLVEAIRAVSQALTAQADFVAEAEHLRLFRQRYDQPGVIRVPRVLDRYCTSDVVTMEYMPGCRSINDSAIAPTIRRAAIVTGLRVLYQMIFESGYFHCDPHPGNFCVGQDGGLVVLDCGFVAAFSPGHRRAFAQFFVSIATRNAALAAQITHDTALGVRPGFDAAAFEAALATVIKACAGRRVGEFQIVRFVSLLFAAQLAHGVRGCPEFTLAILALLTYEGVLKQVTPDLDFQQEAIPILLTALAKR